MDFATKFRPNNLSEVVGQDEILAVLSKFIEINDIPHCLFFGPPGCGKTSVAMVIAKQMNYEYFWLDGANLKSEDIRKILSKFDQTLYKPLIFIDEFHRLSKTQQETLLIPMEMEKCIIIGATTTNPKFVISGGIRSRMMLFEFKPICSKDLVNLLNLIKSKTKFSITNEASDYLVQSSGGDVRGFLNLLYYALQINNDISLKTLKILRSSSVSEGVSSDETHYNLTSAFIKSLRGSDIDAAIYYLARLIYAKEDPVFIARRMVIFSSEDIGNANPNALNLATNTMEVVSKIGYPEARIILSQCAIYLASCPKSNSSYTCINKALEFVEQNDALEIPKYLINTDSQKKNYLYPHDFGGFVKQDYMSKNIKFYKSSKIGFEKTLDEWLVKLKEPKNNYKD